jgi:plasmid stabilization system protein ParE
VNLVWRASALDDLDQVIGYIAERDLAAAERLLDAIEAAADHPFHVPVRPGAGHA